MPVKTSLSMLMDVLTVYAAEEKLHLECSLH